MFLKWAIFASVILNAGLIGNTILLSQSNRLNYQNTQFIDEKRINDVEMLEALLIGRISKEETLKIFSSQFNDRDFFDKPGEKVIGTNGLFLEFDQKNILSNIDVVSIQGP